MNRSKQKGTAAETAVVNYLRDQGFTYVHRNPPAGSKDIGDVGGMPDMVIEVKNCERFELGKWLREVAAEVVNAEALWGVVWAKRRGKASPEDWFVIMDGMSFVNLLKDTL